MSLLIIIFLFKKTTSAITLHKSRLSLVALIISSVLRPACAQTAQCIPNLSHCCSFSSILAVITVLFPNRSSSLHDRKFPLPFANRFHEFMYHPCRPIISVSVFFSEHEILSIPEKENSRNYPPIIANLASFFHRMVISTLGLLAARRYAIYLLRPPGETTPSEG